jgi:two-component system sensor histidine kinase VicK
MRRLAAGTAAWALAIAAAPPVMAQEAAGEATTKLVALIITITIALLVGLLLYQFSQRTSQVQYKEAGERRRPAGGLGDPKHLLPVILEQLHQLPGSADQRERIARTVNDIVVKTLDGQVDAVKQQLESQYGQVIEEQRRSKAVLEHKYQQTLTEKKQTTAVLESIAEGLVVVNNKGQVVMMNPAAEKLLAVRQEERIGQPLLEHLEEGQLVSLVREGADEGREIVVTSNSDSTKRILRASNAVITDENGSTVGMVAVLSDVTKQRQLEELKSEFLSKVSHELRTPIVAMQHAISILTDKLAGPMTADQEKFVGITQRNLERLSLLINDLLDLSKLEARKLELRLQPSHVGQIVDSVCDALGPWADAKALTISRRVPEGLPEVECDQGRIIQVLTNLVGNAIKFTAKQGRVVIEARLAADRDAVEVSVADNGIGIAPEDLPRLFTKFQQVGERTPSDVAGTGLGLAIAKEIIELHHGRIWAESQPQQGARFTFALPLRQQPESGASSG